MIFCLCFGVRFAIIYLLEQLTQKHDWNGRLLPTVARFFFSLSSCCLFLSDLHRHFDLLPFRDYPCNGLIKFLDVLCAHLLRPPIFCNRNPRTFYMNWIQCGYLPIFATVSIYGFSEYPLCCKASQTGCNPNHAMYRFFLNPAQSWCWNCTTHILWVSENRTPSPL